jgi:hypothetical protein
VNPSAKTVTISGTPTVSGTYTYTITTSGHTDPCTEKTITGTVTVNPLPVVTLGNCSNLCVGSTCTLLLSSTMDGTWESNDEDIATVDPYTGVVTGVVAGVEAKTTTFTFENTSTGCASKTDPLTVKPKPVIDDIEELEVCSDETFTVLTANIIGTVPEGTTYAWSPSSPINATPINDTPTNTTNAQIKVVYTVTPTADGCPGATFTVTVPVNPRPDINNIPLLEICSGEPFYFTPINGINNIVPDNDGTTTNYTWSKPIVTDIEGIDGGNGQKISSLELINKTNEVRYVVYTVKPKTDKGCTGDDFTVTVQVNPRPDIKPIIHNEICSGKDFSVKPENGVLHGIVPANTTYTWLEPIVTDITGYTTNVTTTDIDGREAGNDANVSEISSPELINNTHEARNVVRNGTG